LHKINQRIQRSFDSFKTIDDVINILKSQFAERRLYIKYSVDKSEVNINEYLDDGTLLLVTEPGYEHDGSLTIYGLSDKYIEIDFEVIEERGPGYLQCKIRSARRAIKGRRDLRFKVTTEVAVATNFRVSKHSIDLSGFNIPTGIKVVLDQFQTTNSRLGDFVKVDVFSSENAETVLAEIKKTGKSLFIPDFSDRESMIHDSEEFLDLDEIFGNKSDEFLMKNIEKGYRSLLIIPVIYVADNGKSTPFAYIQIISKSENYSIEKVSEVKELSYRLVDRIRDANTLLLPVHQQIMDISRGGAKLKITDENLKTSIYKSKGFIFDIVFKLQAPITIYGEIKSTYTDESGELFVGVDFEGNSSRKDEMKRFYAVLKPMESDYKARLIKSMKNRKG